MSILQNKIKILALKTVFDNVSFSFIINQTVNPQSKIKNNEATIDKSKEFLHINDILLPFKQRILKTILPIVMRKITDMKIIFSFISLLFSFFCMFSCFLFNINTVS